LIAEIGVKNPEDLGVSISPRLFQMYFGLCFIALASAMYACTCPAVVKRHSSAGEYIAMEGDHLGEFALREMEIALANSNENFDAFRKSVQNRISMDYSVQEAGQEVKVSTLALYYDTENERCWFTRLMIFLIYGAGFVIILVPAAKVFWKVSTVLYGLIAEHGFNAIW
jgi:hypothetical protein